MHVRLHQQRLSALWRVVTNGAVQMQQSSDKESQRGTSGECVVENMRLTAELQGYSSNIIAVLAHRQAVHIVAGAGSWSTSSEMMAVLRGLPCLAAMAFASESTKANTRGGLARKSSKSAMLWCVCMCVCVCVSL